MVIAIIILMGHHSAECTVKQESRPQWKKLEMQANNVHFDREMCQKKGLIDEVLKKCMQIYPQFLLKESICTVKATPAGGPPDTNQVEVDLINGIG